MCGFNSYGQLGLGGLSNQKKQMVCFPSLLQLPEKEIVRFIKCDGHTTLLLSNQHNLYQCGKPLNQVKDKIHTSPKRVYLSDQRIMVFFRTWTKEKHNFACNRTKSIIKLLLMLNLKDTNGKNKHPESLWSWLPKDILLYIFEFLIL